MKSSLYAFLALLLMIGVAAPALAKAQSLKLNPTSLNLTARGCLLCCVRKASDSWYLLT